MDLNSDFANKRWIFANFIFRVSISKFFECFPGSCFDSPFINVHKSSMMIYNKKTRRFDEVTWRFFVNPFWCFWLIICRCELENKPVNSSSSSLIRIFSIFLLLFVTVIAQFVLELQWLVFDDDDSVESLRIHTQIRHNWLLLLNSGNKGFGLWILTENWMD
jgi:hypothetical protein